MKMKKKTDKQYESLDWYKCWWRGSAWNERERNRTESEESK